MIYKYCRLFKFPSWDGIGPERLLTSALLFLVQRVEILQMEMNVIMMKYDLQIF